MAKRFFSALVVVGLILVACGPQAGPTGPKQGGTLHVALSIDPDTLDPAAQTTTTASQIVDMVAETLVTIDEKGAVKPLLAEKWEGSSDGLSYTFTLRKGVKFSDGTDFNAQAVKFSIDRLMDPKTFKAQPNVFKDLAPKTTVIDDSHVRFTLKQTFAPFVAAMTQTNAAIISPASVTISGNTPEKVETTVGTGPYKLKERVKGDHITMIRNDAYWGQKPSYEAQELKIVPEAASREALIKAGQADVIMLPPISDLPAMQRDPNLKVILGEADRTIQIIINTQDSTQPLLQKAEVRQALNYAVDKDAIIKNVLFGAAVSVDAPMAKSLVGYCSVGSYNYDPNKAKSMLALAGAAGMSVKFLAPTGRYVQDIEVAKAVAGYLRDAGIKVDGPATSDWPTYTATIIVPPDRAKTDLHMLGWAPPYLDAQQQMEQFYSPRWPPGLATSYYKNPKVDDLIAKANSGLDQDQRKKDYCEASKQVWNDAPWIFLYNQRFPIVHSSKVTGVTVIPIEKFDTVHASPA